MDLPTGVQKACEAVGLATVSYLTYNFARAVYVQLRGSQIQRYHRPNTWALVTGASDGIGKALAHELASHGFHVILHGRNETKLNAVVAELQQAFPTLHFRILVLDVLTPAGPEFDRTVLAAVEDLRVAVVVHNVGGPANGALGMELFRDMDGPTIDGWLDCNVRFAMHLTRILLPRILADQPGLMLYIGSGAAVQPIPYLSVYGASKTFLEVFARQLDAEMRLDAHDVEFKYLTVSTVATASSGRGEKDVSFSMPTTRTFAAAAIAKVGLPDTSVVPYVGHWVQISMISLLPAWFRDPLLRKMSRQFKQQMDAVQKAK